MFEIKGTFTHEAMMEKLQKRNSLNSQYLNQKLTYTSDGRLLDENNQAVMMAWETDLMLLGAKTVAQSRGDILNVGFGMGIIDNFIQTKFAPRSHWIIESHPDVKQKMIEWNWLRQPHVKCIFAQWQEVANYLPKFDGIYFDTWEESMVPFIQILPKILKRDGIFSFFNNPHPDHIKEGYKCRPNIGEELTKQGFEVEFESHDISKIVPNEQDQGRVYWDPKQTTYYNPICVLR